MVESDFFSHGLITLNVTRCYSTQIMKGHSLCGENKDDETVDESIKSRKRSLLSEVIPKGQILPARKSSSRGSFTTTNINGKEYRDYDCAAKCVANNSGSDVKVLATEFSHDRNKTGEDPKYVRSDKANESISKGTENEKENIANAKRELYDKWKERKIGNKMNLR